MISIELVNLVRHLDEPTRRRAVQAACGLAVQRTELHDERAAEALEALRAGCTGDVPERLSIQALVAELDSLAWDIQDRVGTHAAEGAAYHRAFARARAAAALDFAFGMEPLDSAMEALYEAHFAIDDLGALLQAVRSAA